MGVGHRTWIGASRGASQFSETRKRTEPEPVPLWPPTTVNHGAPVVAVHGHEPCVVIVVVSSFGTDMHTFNSTGATEY